MFGEPRFHRPVSFYGRLRWKVLRERRLFFWFVLAAILNGVGHGVTALVAGFLGRSLAGGDNFVLYGAVKLRVDPTVLAFVGLSATFVKGAGTIWGATMQSRLAQKVASLVRNEWAMRLLAGATTARNRSTAAHLAIRVREVERGVEEGVLAGVRAAAQLVPLAAALFAVR